MSAPKTSANVTAISRSAGHHFSKANAPVITLLKGLGVEGDAHAGHTVKHRSRVKANPEAPNLRQVHLVMAETLDRLNAEGFSLRAGDIGENITTTGIDLFALPCGTRLAIGPEAIIEVTGLRNPCTQLDAFQDGLMAATLTRDDEGRLQLRAGIMGIVLAGGRITPGDAIAVTLPPEPHLPLARV
ncbi:MAG: MOSC domain-containing protein [Rhizobiales bacterium]|nr:MOSC domain-containing protein [Hyphomicrobiales bacterium]